MSDDLTLYDLATQVLDWGYDLGKQQWGEELLRLVRFHQDSEEIQQELNSKIVAALGKYVSDIKSVREKQAQARRLMNRSVSYHGRPMTPTLSVRTADGSTQGVLWLDASPQQFIDAVRREQAVIDGRNQSNRLRWQIVQMLEGDEELRSLPALRDVCRELHVNADTLELEGLQAS